MDKKLTIYCCYNDESQIRNYGLKESDSFKLFYALEGLLNSYISEFSMFYNIWKNDKDSDYIGTCHYRRQLSKRQFDRFKVNDSTCQVYEIIGDRTGAYGIESWSQPGWSNCTWIWEDYKNYTKEKYGPNNIYLEIDKKLKDHTYNSNGSSMIRRGTFFLTRGVFMGMCDFIFGFLDYFDSKYNLQYDSDKYHEFIKENWWGRTNGNIPFFHAFPSLGNPKNHLRLLAYLFEWMSSIYLQANLKNFYLL